MRAAGRGRVDAAQAGAQRTRHSAGMDALPAPPSVERPTLAEGLRRRLQVETGAPVSLVETHISWVLLAQRLAYKLKKPVRLPFVDFGSVAARRHFCEEEVRLNRRLAPTLYLDVVAVRGTPHCPRLDGPGDPIDHAVRMRRFPPGALFSERLAGGRLLPEHLDGLAQRLAAFHRQAPVVPPGPAGDAQRRVVAPVLAVLAQLRPVIGGPRTDALATWVHAAAQALQATWAARERDGRVRDGHGDLHLANALVLDGEATAFDCIEFDPSLRRIDVMADIAFLVMDLRAHRRDDLAFRFLGTYLECGGDYAGLPVLRFYEVYRALVRALVRALGGSLSAGVAPVDYPACAERLATDAGALPRLMITHGLSGSGKSTVTQHLVGLAGAVRVRSDVERKRLFGLEALARSAGRVPIYDADANRRTVERLADCARTALGAGYPVIVDATFLRRADRATFEALAAGMNLPFTILDCTASASCLRERVRRRRESGDDASEADLAVLAQQEAAREPLSAAERAQAIEVATDGPVDARALCERWLGRVAPG